MSAAIGPVETSSPTPRPVASRFRALPFVYNGTALLGAWGILGGWIAGGIFGALLAVPVLLDSNPPHDPMAYAGIIIGALILGGLAGVLCSIVPAAAIGTITGVIAFTCAAILNRKTVRSDELLTVTFETARIQAFRGLAAGGATFAIIGSLALLGYPSAVGTPPVAPWYSGLTYGFLLGSIMGSMAGAIHGAIIGAAREQFRQMTWPTDATEGAETVQ